MVKASQKHRVALENKSLQCQINANRFIAELAAIAFSDIRDVLDSDGRTRPLDKIPPHISRAIASYKVRLRIQTRVGRDRRKVTEIVESISVRFHSKIQALYALGCYLGMFRERPAAILERTPVAIQLACKKVGRSR